MFLSLIKKITDFFSIENGFVHEKRDSFQIALEFVLRWEGGYVNDPQDRGGATNKGVTQRVYDSYMELNHSYTKSVRSISNDEVEAIYRLMYWDVIKGDLLPLKIAVAVFDWAVNSGPHRAIKKLQDVLGVKIDGVVGPVTINAIREMPCNEDLILRYLEKRRRFYLVIGKGEQKKFLRGWLNRLDSLRSFLKTL